MLQSAEEEKIWTRQDLRSRICNCCCLHSPEACKKVSLNFVFLYCVSTYPTPLCLSPSQRSASLGSFLCCNAVACPLLPQHRFCTSCACNTHSKRLLQTSHFHRFPHLSHSIYLPPVEKCRVLADNSELLALARPCKLGHIGGWEEE